MRTTLRTAGVAVRAMLVFTVLLGVGYMLLITGIGQLALPSQANGSLVRSADGTVVGSSLIAQSFQDADGTALPQYFQSRPSAASWDAAASTGSNLGPENADLIDSISANRAAFEALNGSGAIPADAVTSSASGLDPDISAANAERQVARVAEARGIPVSDVEALVAEHTLPRDLGFLGDPRVNVLELNRALDAR
ncbi:potassium-transporting ATPase subunit KdpC [Microbacterium proteolyticum]|uniref:potassium-transporting ATPase subunit KdpC n=1 Tax=Microbacterium proteolyticum TaxID=1572644 RepID=UPI00241630CE|nr:potassium-transporting ATPase subunit KdpC [Microbacterium proteolyticum]